MKWFSLFLVFGILAIIGSLGTLTAAEPNPNPEPKGRPYTTRRPRNDNDDDRR
ncbi:uncharacterized protein LOC110177503 [Drosophila serrata]|uniref:uncharacterized protein LOC110177503 n=1 Tax=Drosophila serrata TaxID=7274 RepID=UPI000A1D38C1|nr:uncharacterized protein LOC110177503 [Drosophila serrata]KAH8376223.1 hypothetical protein KR200_004646 [Drosophila serrata]